MKASAQAAYPLRDITLIVPFPPGGQADLAARGIAEALKARLGANIIIDNRSGASGAVGNAAAARAAVQDGERGVAEAVVDDLVVIQNGDGVSLGYAVVTHAHHPVTGLDLLVAGCALEEDRIVESGYAVAAGPAVVDFDR